MGRAMCIWEAEEVLGRNNYRYRKSSMHRAYFFLGTKEFIDAREVL